MTNNIIIFLKKIKYYPLVLGSFPIFALYNHNIKYVQIADFLRILFISLAVILIFLVVISLIVKDSQKSALVVSLVILKLS